MRSWSALEPVRIRQSLSVWFANSFYRESYGSGKARNAVFTARRLASAVCAVVLCPSVCLSVTSLTYKVLHGTAPRYLGPLDRVADLHGRRALRSASSSRLVVPMFRLSTVGSRAFNVSGPLIWNELPKEVVSGPTFSSLRC